MKWTSLLTVLSLVASSACGQVLLDFETSTDLSGNFRSLASGSAVQTANGAGNDYIIADRTGSQSGTTLLYDTTPGDATNGTQSVFAASGLTVSFDFVLQSPGSSIGLWFADPTNLSNNILALVNLDNSGTNDLFRFYRNGNLGTTGVGTQVGSNVSASSGIDIGSPFSAFSLTLTNGDTVPELSLTLGSQTISRTLSGLGFDFPNGVVVALRLFDNSTTSGNGVLLDNFEVQAVPEPSAAFLFLLGGVCLYGLRRRFSRGRN